MKNEDEKIRISKSSFKEWLEKLQQESWQLELLISGFALFAIWEARVLVDGFRSYMDIYEPVNSGVEVILSIFGVLLTVGWRIFFFNLLIHVIARGLWIGAIGLRYVSGDIDYSYFDYADIFTNFLQKRVGHFDDYIEKLERFSSVIFAYTFLLFFIFLSLNLFIIETFSILLFIENPGISGLVVLLFLFIGLIVLIDFLTMGGVKKIKDKHISKIYFVIYRFFSLLTLSFLYRPLLYNFWDEKYTRRLFLISIPYMFFLFFIQRIEMDAYPFFPDFQQNYTEEKLTYEYQYYDDERALAQKRKRGIFRRKDDIKGISLPSIELKGNYSWFFLRSYPSDANWLAEEKNIVPYREQGIGISGRNEKEDKTIKQLDSLSSLNVSALFKDKLALRKRLRKKEVKQLEKGVIVENGAFKIDGLFWKEKQDSIERYWWEKKEAYNFEKVEKLNRSLLDLITIKIDEIDYKDSCECKLYIHPNLGEKGLRCYFSMKNLEEGPHLIHLNRRQFKENRQRNITKDVFHDYYVPFYKIDKDN